MEWQNPTKYKRSSVSMGMPYSQGGYGLSYTSPQQQQRTQFYSGRHALLPPSSNGNNRGLANEGGSGVLDRHSYYFSPDPLYCSDWTYLNGGEMDCIALSSYKEGFSNKILVVHGVGYGREATCAGNGDMDDDDVTMGSPTSSAYQDDAIEGFDFHKVAEVSVYYPVTNLQWDPSMLRMGNGVSERLGASLEVLRLYKVDHEALDKNSDYKLTQTHILANNTATASSSTSSSAQSNTGASGSASEDMNTFPPVTSFDWNKVDPNLIITSSVDTTCTVWDLNRSSLTADPSSDLGAATDTATVKTQLIAHDSEVFDVKFIHNSTNVFASVGNDGSMRVFDLRSLEHSTIIYEPSHPPTSALTLTTPHHNSRALLKLSASNIDQNYLATIGVNSNQVIIIDMRMPGLPVAALDGSLGGANTAAINSIQWHPSSNYLLTGGDDCQALVWDCNNIRHPGAPKTPSSASSHPPEFTSLVESPVLAYSDDLEVNNVCWRRDQGDWMGVVSGKGFQAVLI